MKSDIEELLAFQIKASGLPKPWREYTFHAIRRWRFDFAWPDIYVAVEVQGGIWLPRHNKKSGHTTGKGITADCEKLSHAAIDGWRVLPVTAEQVKSGVALSWIEDALKSCEAMGELTKQAQRVGMNYD